ncbi:MAG: tryptophan synthase subunit alpha [Deltaproteobacteria bacterium RBG_16_47_11]|nr:MAG: tryptophan synthase subunit alpha [Deltaproteobacteria bacterium RBG_16_47_11]
MNRIEWVFKKLRNKRAAFIPFVVAGDPDLKTTEALVRKIAECGADIIEIGVPFSDPLADGPTIQAASQRALKNGVNLRDIFLMAEGLKGISTPLVLMTYFNPVFQHGLKNFAEDCYRHGIDGVIIPDLPPEEAGPWIQEAKPLKLDTIFLIAPTSSPDRVKLASRYSRGFLYYVSITGVTGTRGKLPEELEVAIRQIRKYSPKPVAVGFGISTAEQVKEVSRIADGVIVGSAIVKMIEENLKQPDMVIRVGGFVLSLAEALAGTCPVPPKRDRRSEGAQYE